MRQALLMAAQRCAECSRPPQSAAAGTLQRRADDGLHGPPLPAPLPVAVEGERFVHGNGHREHVGRRHWCAAPREGDRWLAHDDEEDKTILQLGGSSPKVLGAATELAIKHHTYAGVNSTAAVPVRGSRARGVLERRSCAIPIESRAVLKR